MRSDRETAYVAFVAARQHHLRRIAYALCGDWHQADDLLQTALVKLYVAWPRLHRDGREEAYCRQIMTGRRSPATPRSAGCPDQTGLPGRIASATLTTPDERAAPCPRPTGSTRSVRSPIDEKLAAYVQLAGPAMRAAGGTFLARGLPAAAFESGIVERRVRRHRSRYGGARAAPGDERRRHDHRLRRRHPAI